MNRRGQIALDLVMITLGCGIYALGLVAINIANHLAEGGITGITLILRALLHIDPAYSTLLINIPLIIIGFRFLGLRSLLYTIYGTLALSAWIYFWQRIPLNFDIHHDMFLAAICAGLCGGFGSGLVYRFGGTTGGTDIVARIFEKHHGIAMGQTLLCLDTMVLIASLSYIDLQHTLYTLLAAYVFSRIVNIIQEGAYSARGVLIFSSKSDQIATTIMAQLERGVSFLNAEGAFSKQTTKAIYCVVAPSELTTLKRIVSQHDERAFISVIDVNDVVGEGFTYGIKKKTLLK